MNMLHKSLISASIMLAVSGVWADTATDNLDISLTVQAACSVLSVDDVNETVNTGFTGVHATSGNVNVTCNNTHPYRIAMGAGTHMGSGVRHVSDGINDIPYQITKNSNSAVWGSQGVNADNSYNNDGGGTNYDDQNGTGIGSAQAWGYGLEFTLTGAEAAGTYTDTVLVTLEF